MGLWQNVRLIKRDIEKVFVVVGAYIAAWFVWKHSEEAQSSWGVKVWKVISKKAKICMYACPCLLCGKLDERTDREEVIIMPCMHSVQGCSSNL